MNGKAMGVGQFVAQAPNRGRQPLALQPRWVKIARQAVQVAVELLRVRHESVDLVDDEW